MKKFRWILLSGLLVAAPQIAQAQPPGQGFDQSAPGQGGAATGDAGAIVSPGAAATTTTTTTTGIAPDASFVPADDAAFGNAAPSSPRMADTGGEPLIAVLAGLSIAGAAVAMRRKVTA